MAVESVRVSTKYQVVIPKSIRENLGVEKGDELAVTVQGDAIVMRVKPASFTDYMHGLHREVWEGVDAAQYVDREREAWERKPKE